MQTQTHTRVTLRPFVTTDYEAITRLHNGTFGPEFTKEPDEIRFDDEREPDYCKHARWIAELDGRVVGAVGYAQPAHRYHPRRFSLEIVVDPEYQQRGIGRVLYDHVMREVAQFEPERVDEWTREDMPCRVGFLEHRGFVADMRMWTSVLDLFAFDPSRFSAPVSVEGIRIATFAELGVADEAVQRRVFDLWMDTRQDVPAPPGDVRAERSFEQWWEGHNRPTLLPDGYFIAVDGDQYVAMSQLWLSPEAEVLRTGLTATRRSHRRRGLARMLKIAALTWAKSRGYRWVKTENEINNQGMIAINDELGFRKRPAWVHYAKNLGGQAQP